MWGQAPLDTNAAQCGRRLCIPHLPSTPSTSLAVPARSGAHTSSPWTPEEQGCGPNSSCCSPSCWPPPRPHTVRWGRELGRAADARAVCWACRHCRRPLSPTDSRRRRRRPFAGDVVRLTASADPSLLPSPLQTAPPPRATRPPASAPPPRRRWRPPPPCLSSSCWCGSPLGRSCWALPPSAAHSAVPQVLCPAAKLLCPAAAHARRWHSPHSFALSPLRSQTNDDAVTVITAPAVRAVLDRFRNRNGCPLPCTW